MPLPPGQAEQDQRRQAQNEEEGEEDQGHEHLLHPHPRVHTHLLLPATHNIRLGPLFAAAAEQHRGEISPRAATLLRWLMHAGERGQRLHQDRVQAEEGAHPLPRVGEDCAGLPAGVGGVGLVALHQPYTAATGAGWRRRAAQAEKLDKEPTLGHQVLTVAAGGVETHQNGALRGHVDHLGHKLAAQRQVSIQRQAILAATSAARFQLEVDDPEDDELAASSGRGSNLPGAGLSAQVVLGIGGGQQVAAGPRGRSHLGAAAGMQVPWWLKKYFYYFRGKVSVHFITVLILKFVNKVSQRYFIWLDLTLLPL